MRPLAGIVKSFTMCLRGPSTLGTISITFGNRSVSLFMKTNAGFVATLALASAISGATAAEVTGKVTLKGAAPAEKPIALDAQCGKLHSAAITTRHYVVGSGNGLANVFVYVKAGLESKKFEPSGEGQLLDQVNCLYEPYVMGVQTNQKFKIRNSDALLHNVHGTPKNPANKEFNFGQPIKGQVNERSFPASEVLVRLKCDVHPWMFAYVGVVDSPFFAVTDKDGNFKLPGNLPAGKYTIEAFHLKAGAVTQEITVGDGDKKALEFSLEPKAQ